MYKKTTKIIIITSLILLTTAYLPVYAEETPNIQEQLDYVGEHTPIESERELPKFVGQLIKWAIGIVGVMLITLLVYGGFSYATSAGNEEKLGTAKKIIVYAIVGVVIIGLAYVLTDFVIDMLFPLE
ncbi:unnamed protein product [marine sediment metagenome]|uniref:TrbC/VIRB2 family protein n=1 Tax=marine sediment metagenome TaxID=412755 RepID=X0VAS5_9ZZZZ